MVKAKSPTASRAEMSGSTIWAKRQVKAMAKLQQEILKMLQSLQLHFDIKASMAEDEDEE